MKTHTSPTRFKWIQRLAALVTALAMISVSTGSAQAAKLFQIDDYFEHDSEGMIFNADGTPGTDTAKIKVDSSGNFTVDADGEINTTDPVNFSGAASTRLREETFTAYTGIGVAPTCTTVGEVATDLTTNNVYVCTNAGTDTWEVAGANLADGTAAGNMLYWDGTAWVETTAITTDGTDVNVTGDFDTDGVIVAGSGDTQITNATGDLQQTYNFTSDNILSDNDSVYSALDKLDSEFALIDFEYVYVNDADQTLTASGTFDIDATGAVGIDSDSTMTIGGTAVSITADSGTLDLTGDGTNDINITNTGAAIDVGSATFTLDTTGVFSIDGVGTSNVITDTGDLQLYTTTSGDVDINAATDVNTTAAGAINFTDANDTLTFSQVSAALGNDLLNTPGEIFSSTGSIGATIGVGENATSLIGAINMVGTYAATLGAGAKDNIDDVYDNSIADATMYADVDTSSTGYNITSVDGDAFAIQNSGTPFASFLVDASNNSLIDFDPYDMTVDATNVISLDAAAASNFTTSAGDLTLSATTNSVVVTGAEAAADAVTITASNAAGGVDINAGTGGITMDSTGAISIDAAGASNVTTSSGNLTLSATAGQVVFDDLQLNGTVQMSVADADWDTDFTTDGIVDNINDIATLLGGDTISTYNFTEDNVLADNDAVYVALNKLDLKWGDLASTANGEGASLVGIEDTGGYYASTDVEGALQELGTFAGQKVETLRFYPEYPDAVYDAGIDRGRLDAIYDATEGNAYEWTTQQTADQTMIIRERFEMPSDFADVNDLTLRYKTSTANTADNSVALALYNVTDITSCSSVAAAASAAWTTMTLAEATIEGACTLDAGDIVEVRVTLLADKNGGAYAGHVLLGYDK